MTVAPEPARVEPRGPIRFPFDCLPLYPPPDGYEPIPYAIVRIDVRRGPAGERYRGMTFATAELARAWTDGQGDDVRRELIAGGFAVRQSPEPRPRSLDRGPIEAAGGSSTCTGRHSLPRPEGRGPILPATEGGGR
jgi:hypothetical protein